MADDAVFVSACVGGDEATTGGCGDGFRGQAALGYRDARTEASVLRECGSPRFMRGASTNGRVALVSAGVAAARDGAGHVGDAVVNDVVEDVRVGWRRVVGREVSKPPPRSIATSTSAAPSRICGSCSARITLGARAPWDQDGADDSVYLGQEFVHRAGPVQQHKLVHLLGERQPRWARCNVAERLIGGLHPVLGVLF
jgi:hypothetical protein